MTKEIIFHYKDYILCLNHEIQEAGSCTRYWGSYNENNEQTAMHIELTDEEILNLIKQITKMYEKVRQG